MAVCQKVIGRNIRELRTQMGLTQEEAAEKMRVSTIHYGRLERGERAISLRCLEDAARLFGVPIMQILCGAFPDDILVVNREQETDDFARRINHLSHSLTQKEQAVVLALCRIMALSN